MKQNSEISEDSKRKPMGKVAKVAKFIEFYNSKIQKLK